MVFQQSCKITPEKENSFFLAAKAPIIILTATIYYNHVYIKDNLLFCQIYYPLCRRRCGQSIRPIPLALFHPRNPERRRLSIPLFPPSTPLLSSLLGLYFSTYSTAMTIPNPLHLRGGEVLAALFFLFPFVLAHGGHEQVPEGSAVSEDPIVRFACPP